MTPANLTWIGTALEQGRFQVVEKLGEGGMAVVYKAVEQSTGQVVVIKAPKLAALEDDTFLKRFAAENQALMTLRHPHIVPILHVGEFRSWPFAVLQYLSGGDLGTCREAFGGRLSLLNISKWLPKISDALDYIHRQGYVHRDVKPANILFDGRGNCFLGDFGVAKVISDRKGTSSQLTNTGMVMGTPDYMAPELIMGRAVDGRIDQYALAMTVYECLAGRLPFRAATPAAVLVFQTTQKLPPLSQFNPDLPAGISDVLMRALAKKPSERFPSCPAFADELLGVIEQNGILGAAPTMAYPMPTLAVPAMTGEFDPATANTVGLAKLPTKNESPRPGAISPETSWKLLRWGWIAAGLLCLSLSLFVAFRNRNQTSPEINPTSTEDVLAESGNVQETSPKTDETQQPPPIVTEPQPNADEALPENPPITENDTTPLPVPPKSLNSPQEPTAAVPLKAPFDQAAARAGQEAWARHLNRRVIETNSSGMRLVLIPPGEFQMGEPGKQVAVTLTQPFYLGETEVTQAQWQQLMGFKTWEGRSYVKDVPNHAASYISWNDAMSFCILLTDQDKQTGQLPKGWKYSLPTEAQWEYACRAGTTTAYSFGDDASRLGEYAWFNENTGMLDEKYPHAVQKKLPNPFGLYGMHGNVAEWCRDWYQPDLPGGVDPEVTVEAPEHVFRRGDWVLDAQLCQSWVRSHYGAYQHYGFGFRVALVPETEDPAILTSGEVDDSITNSLEFLKSLRDRGISITFDSRGNPTSIRFVPEILTDEDLQQIAKCKSITRITLGHQWLENEITKLRYQNPLQVTESGFAQLAELPLLTHLEFSMMRLDEGHLRGIGTLTNLQVLLFDTTNGTHSNGPLFHDQGLKSLENLKELRYLDLSNCQGFTDAGLESVAQLKNLEILKLSNTPITDQGLQYLETLSNLSELKISYCKLVTRAGLVSLGRMKTLKTLDVSGIRIFGKDLENLLPLAPTLESLSCFVSDLDDSSCKVLAQFSNLKRLSLVVTGVTDAGLVDLEVLPNLTYIYIYGSKVTQAGIDRLKAKYPQATINFQKQTSQYNKYKFLNKTP